MKAARLIALVLLLLPVGSPRALSTDSEQPISVEADNLEIRDAENISIHDGNVKLVQGSLEIDSDRLVIHFSDANELLLMEMTGSPVHYRQLDDQQREMLGEARRMEYRKSESVLEMRESAWFSHAGDRIESDLIRINTRDNSLQAGSADSDKRVKMLIQPRQGGAPPE